SSCRRRSLWGRAMPQQLLREAAGLVEMNISPETVRMHRKNVYLKLEVGAQSELLFALFIEWPRKH
ncbi:LuxR C-terminal-related transcriptional regulator, partial [Pseudomonas sp. 18173]|uniref:LuxR C-terminal-related transcriptional regulator n=1 Tax=Pseudomonas sp. 18173 TaxID=3390055 RepID=UPI003D263634